MKRWEVLPLAEPLRVKSVAPFGARFEWQEARPTSLRQISSHIARPGRKSTSTHLRRCMQAAKSALKENKKPWEKVKALRDVDSEWEIL